MVIAKQKYCESWKLDIVSRFYVHTCLSIFWIHILCSICKKHQLGFFTSVLICPKCLLALSTINGTKSNPFPWLVSIGVKWWACNDSPSTVLSICADPEVLSDKCAMISLPLFCQFVHLLDKEPYRQNLNSFKRSDR